MDSLCNKNSSIAGIVVTAWLSTLGCGGEDTAVANENCAQNPDSPECTNEERAGENTIYYSCNCHCICEMCAGNGSAEESTHSTCEALCEERCEAVPVCGSFESGMGECNEPVDEDTDYWSEFAEIGELCGSDTRCPVGATCAKDPEAEDYLCVATGGEGQPCANGDTCVEPYECWSWSGCPEEPEELSSGPSRRECCVMPGGEWMPCHPDDTCDDDLICFPARSCPEDGLPCCVGTGGSGQPCNPDDTCNSGMACVPVESCINDAVYWEGEVRCCVKAGSEGDACYPDDTCDDGLVCSSDFELCANLGYSCCVPPS
jgi:hypothetical protein